MRGRRRGGRESSTGGESGDELGDIKTQNAVKNPENGIGRFLEINIKDHHAQLSVSLPVPSGRHRTLEPGMHCYGEEVSLGLHCGCDVFP